MSNPLRSLVGVLDPLPASTLRAPSASLLKAAEEALERQEAVRFLPYHEQVHRMALFLTDTRLGGP